jgi:peptidoglycan/LPS O-acetylase OafA/YrhL
MFPAEQTRATAVVRATVGEPPARIPSLDGLRALSVLGVLVFHTLQPFRDRFQLPGMGMLMSYGYLGVRVFFAISGYLITSLLLKEKRLTGTVDLKAFYLRRAFRILPAYWTFLLVVFAFTRLETRDLLLCAFFLSDFFSVGWIVSHSWTLSVEEQFYVFWPLALRTLDARKAIIAGAAIWCLTPAIRCAWISLSPSLIGIFGQLDSLMVGCLLALSEATPAPRLRRLFAWLSRPSMAFFNAFFLLGLSPLLVALLRHRDLSGPVDVLQCSIESLSIAGVLAWAINHSSSKVGRFLNWSPVARVGVISYSLYLWQQPFLWDALKGKSFLMTVVHLALVFAVAQASFRLIETPFLRLGRRVRKAFG